MPHPVREVMADVVDSFTGPLSMFASIMAGRDLCSFAESLDSKIRGTPPYAPPEKKPNRWIPVEECLPRHGDYVAFRKDGRVGCGFYKVRKFEHSKEFWPGTVTHWRYPEREDRGSMFPRFSKPIQEFKQKVSVMHIMTAVETYEVDKLTAKLKRKYNIGGDS